MGPASGLAVTLALPAKTGTELEFVDGLANGKELVELTDVFEGLVEVFDKGLGTIVMVDIAGDALLLAEALTVAFRTAVEFGENSKGDRDAVAVFELVKVDENEMVGDSDGERLTEEPKDTVTVAERVTDPVRVAVAVRVAFEDGLPLCDGDRDILGVVDGARLVEIDRVTALLLEAPKLYVAVLVTVLDPTTGLTDALRDTSTLGELD
jgi:hypothetical protein